MRESEKENIDRFWGKVKRGSKTSCWPWLSQRQEKGHGRFWYGGRLVQAHRRSWEINIGKIPDGLWVLHECDVPFCVNPNHLFLGTHEDNMQDMVKKGRAAKNRGAATITQEQAIKIKSSKEPRRKISKKYHISVSQVSRIQRNKCWVQHG